MIYRTKQYYRRYHFVVKGAIRGKELQTYLVRLKHETQASKRSTARRVREMKAGHLTTVDELEARYRNRD